MGELPGGELPRAGDDVVHPLGEFGQGPGAGGGVAGAAGGAGVVVAVGDQPDRFGRADVEVVDEAGQDPEDGVVGPGPPDRPGRPVEPRLRPEDDLPGRLGGEDEGDRWEGVARWRAGSTGPGRG